MKFTAAILSSLALAATTLAAGPINIKRAGSNSFGGANNYYIHTLDAATQSAYVQQLSDINAKVVRLWVTGLPGGCVKGSSGSQMTDVEPTLGQYDDTSLKALDNLMAQLHSAGIKVLLSPHNGNNLAGDNCKNDPYCTKWDAESFYTNSDAFDAYDARLAHILNYQSPNFNKTWSQMSEVIMAFDVQNEPFITASDLAAGNDNAGWLCGRAQKLQSLINGSGVKVATGGIGGSQYDGHEYNLMQAALDCDAVDIISMHSYLTAQQWGEFIPSSLDTAGEKHLLIEEFGVGGKIDASEFPGIISLFNGAKIPFLYWEVIPAADETQSCSDSCCHASMDGFEIGPNSTKGDIKSAIQAANSEQATQDWTGFVY